MGRGSNDLSLRVILSAQDKASGMLRGFGSTLVNLAGKAGPLLSAMLAISAAVISFTAASVQMAAQYDQSLRMVQSLTNQNSAQMAQYDSQLKTLAVDAGVAPNALAQGLYNVLSASYRGADAMKVLTLATEDAKIGMTSASVTTDALTNILRSFNVQSKDITATNGQMLQTVTLGKATFEQYAQSIVKSASAAVQFHVNMQTMNAAWATMTSSGIRAAQASTDFQQSLKVMYGNIGTVTASLHKNGIAFNESKFNAMSYRDKVLYLNQALEQANEKHVKVTGVTLQASQAVSTIAKHIKDYDSNLKQLSDKQAMNQKTGQAWAVTQQGLSQQLSRAQAAVQVLMIDIGQKLLPVLTQIVSAIAPAIQGFINFASACSKNEVVMALLKGFLVGFAVVVIALIVPAFIAWAVAAWGAAAGTLAATWPILAIGAAVALVVAGIVLAVQNWGKILDWISGKAEQTRIKVELEHSRMAQITDQKTIASANKAIANYEKQKQGILLKLKETHSAAERAELQHQLKMLNLQEEAQKKRLQKAEADKQAQLKKQKELHAQYLEAQKNWFQRLMDTLGTFFGNIFGAIGSFFGNIFGAIGTFLGNVFGSIGAAIGNFFSGLGTLVHSGMMAVFNFFLSPFRLIGNLFGWLYQHNIYFQRLVDSIKRIVTTGLNIIHNLWQNAVTRVTRLWNSLKDHAIQIWTDLRIGVASAVSFLVNWVHNQIQQHIDDLRQKWLLLQSIVRLAWARVQAVISSAWNTYIVGPLRNLWNSVMGFVNGWPRQLFTAGVNLIKQFIAGIGSMVGNVVNAVKNVASKVAGFLGFHSPTKEGPGSQSHKWAPALVDMFSRGLMDGQPKIQAALNAMVSPMLMMNHPPALSGSVPYGRPPAGNSYSSYAGGNTHNGDIVIHAPAGMNVKQLADEIERRRDRKFRSSGLMGNPARGMRNS